jgi:D-3-phosphoglycerate dehydrogenase
VPHVLVAGRIHQAGIERLRAAPGVTLDLVDEVSVESYAPLIERADAVLIRTQPMPARVIARAARLRVVSRHGVGYDAVDVTALNHRKIPLAVVGDVNSRSVAEQTFMLMLALAKRVRAYDQATRDGNWQFRDSREAVDLAGKTLLLIGFGRIGRIVAGLATAFQMRITVNDAFVDPSVIRDAGAVPAADLGSALEQADIVSVHIPRATGTPLLGAPELARMKPSSMVINTARGGLIDEDALDAALRAGRLGGAGLDVLDIEPPQPDHPLLSNERVLITPHAAGLTEECAMRTSTAAAQNILDYFAGTLDPALVVNRDHVSLVPEVPVRA